MKVALIGPSASGKTTIIRSYMKKYDDFTAAKNFTTRPQRGVEDDEFIFVSEAEFRDLLNQDFFFEYEYMFDNYYGTPAHNLGKTNVFFNIDVKGVMKLQNNISDLIVVFVITPTKEDLICRLKNRNCASNIEKRLQRIEEEIHNHHVSDYKIVNDTVEESVEILRNIIQIERMKHRFDKIIHNF